MRPGRQYAAWVAGYAVVAAAAFLLFGAVGFASLVAFAALFIVPPFLLLRKSGLDVEEKLFFSLFAGVGLFSLAVFAVNQLLPSLRLSAVAAFALAAVLPLLAGIKPALRQLQRRNG